MKKLLSILGSIGMVATASVGVVSCTSLQTNNLKINHQTGEVSFDTTLKAKENIDIAKINYYYDIVDGKEHNKINAKFIFNENPKSLTKNQNYYVTISFVGIKGHTYSLFSINNGIQIGDNLLNKGIKI